MQRIVIPSLRGPPAAPSGRADGRLRSLRRVALVRQRPGNIVRSGLKTMPRPDMPAARVLFAAVFTLSPGIAGADSHGQGVSQYRNGPFDEFDLTAIGIVLVGVMIVLGVRALVRRRS